MNQNLDHASHVREHQKKTYEQGKNVFFFFPISTREKKVFATREKKSSSTKNTMKSGKNSYITGQLGRVYYMVVDVESTLYYTTSPPSHLLRNTLFLDILNLPQTNFSIICDILLISCCGIGRKHPRQFIWLYKNVLAMLILPGRLRLNLFQ